jgi:acetyl esterase/lipase
MGFETLVLETAPPLDPAWLEHEEERKHMPAKEYASIFERQVGYAQECRELHAGMMAPGARHSHLSQGLLVQEFAVRSTKDKAWVPMLQYFRQRETCIVESSAPETVIIYYHGGGLYVGEADSEDLSCRQIMHSATPNMTLYSVGYRLMPANPASTCHGDALDAFNWLRARSGDAKLVLVGSSSGGELAAP